MNKTPSVGLAGQIELLQKKLNSDEYLPPFAHRRNAKIYDLVSYVNNLTGCYLSGNFPCVLNYVERCRAYEVEHPFENEKVKNYFSLVNSYIYLVELYISGE
jgi:hypothetical protein